MRFTEPTNKTIYLLASVVKWLAMLPRSFRLTCVEIDSGTPGKRFVYLGEGESLQYIREILACGDGQFPVSRIPLWHIGKTIRRLTSPDTLLCLELNRLLQCLTPGRGFLTFPWIRQLVVLNGNEYRAKKRSIEDDFGRKVRKYKYRFRLVNDETSIVRFYEELYVPYITARFKNLSHMRSLDEIQRCAGSGFILQVLYDDVWVSGAVCRVSKDEILALAFGHLPEEVYPLRFGALSAVYYFLFEYAREHAKAKVDLLRSRPHAGDGVYCHKQRWGAEPQKDFWQHTAIRVYLQDEFSLPPSLGRLLIWDGNGFSEMGELWMRQRES